MNTQEREDRYESGVVPKRGISIVRGKGARVWEDEGNEYLDFGASFGVCNVGHCNDDVVQAISEQAQRLIFVQSSFYNDVRSQVLESS